MEKLDSKDKQILFQLDLDSRQTFKEIGKKVKLSREVVQYRITQLEKKGIIKGYQTLIDITKLGYLNCRFFIKFQKDTPEEEKQVIEYYKNHKNFWWVDSIDGFRDLGIACWVKDAYEFFEIKEDLMIRFGKMVSELSIAIYTKFYIYKRTYLVNENKRNNTEKIIFSAKRAKYDEKDIAILKLITPNSRMSLVEISQKTKMSPTNVNFRIKNMIKNGIITDFRVIIDLEKIGYYWYKVELQLEDLSKKKGMLSYLKEQPNIIYAYETISENDLEFEMEVKNYEEFRKILDEIRKIFGKSIKRYHHLLWYKEHKFLFMPQYN